MLDIPISKTFFDENEKEAILKPLESGWVTEGPYVAEFEKRFASYVGSKFAKATSNCTTALHLALLALDIGPGDKVIVPAFTYVATANAVRHTGAEVVFADIDLSTYNLDITQLENILISETNIKAIIPVNLFGLCAQLEEINFLASNYNIKVVEDSACGFGSWFHNKHSGTFGDLGCFSFHPRKSITTGEGGMVVTDDKSWFEKVSKLSRHGANSMTQVQTDNTVPILPDVTAVGFNYRMTDFQGAIGISQVEKSDYILNGRKKIASQYNDFLYKHPVLMAPNTPPDFTHSYQSYVCLFLDGYGINELNMERVEQLNKKRNTLMTNLAQQGISTRQGTHAVHILKYYKNRYNLREEDLFSAYAADRLTIALPLYPQMTDEEFRYVTSQINQALELV